MELIFMPGRVYSRKYAKGRVAYTGYYTDPVDRTKEVSAGTYPTWQEADDAWRDADREIRKGTYRDPRAGKMPLADYVMNEWLPGRDVKRGTKSSDAGQIRSILAHLGHIPLGEISLAHLRAYVADMRAQGLSTGTIRRRRALISAILQSAVGTKITHNVCHDLKIKADTQNRFTVLEEDEAEALLEWYTSDDPATTDLVEAGLLIETTLETGCRWGEVTDLRPSDIKKGRRGNPPYIKVNHAVADVGPEFSADGGRYFEEETTKGYTDREIEVPEDLYDALQEHIALHGIGRNELIFSQKRMRAEFVLRFPKKAKLTVADMPSGLEPYVVHQLHRGRTPITREHSHGTFTAYGAGCRCTWCAIAMNDHRKEKQSSGTWKGGPKGEPRVATRINTTDHVEHDWFRKNIWTPSRESIEMPELRFHDLRHTHATWLLMGGATIMDVKERLGHASTATTEKYLHRLKGRNRVALDALDNVRSRKPRRKLHVVA